MEVMQMVSAGRQCVLLSEAKNNVTVQLKSTQSKLTKVKNSWDELCELSAESSDLSGIGQQYFEALPIAESRSYSIMLAVGVTNFPEHGLAFRQSWLAVSLEGSRSGIAVLMSVQNVKMYFCLRMLTGKLAPNAAASSTLYP